MMHSQTISHDLDSVTRYCAATSGVIFFSTDSASNCCLFVLHMQEPPNFVKREQQQIQHLLPCQNWHDPLAAPHKGNK